MSVELAPIVVFAFNRSAHFEMTLSSLAKNDLAIDSHVYVFLDGPRIETDRNIQKEIQGFLGGEIRDKFASLSLFLSTTNKGLSESIIQGVTKIVNKHGKIIVLEDDMITSKYFIKYMNDALRVYENEERVISIHGYLNPIKAEFDAPFFLKGADCWGWATWARGWGLFEADGKKLLDEIQNRNIEYEFNFNNTYNYIGMLKDQIAGKNNSWAIRWYASAFLKDKLTLYPFKSLVDNIGLDGSGEHCDNTSTYSVKLWDAPINNFPKIIEESKLAYGAHSDFYQSVKPNFFIRIMNKLRRTFK